MSSGEKLPLCFYKCSRNKMGKYLFYRKMMELQEIDVLLLYVRRCRRKEFKMYLQ